MKKELSTHHMLDPALGALIQALVRGITWYQEVSMTEVTIEPEPPPKEDPMAGYLKRLQGTTARTEREKVRPTYYDLRLEVKPSLKYMHTRMDWRRKAGKRWVYRFECDCEAFVILTAEEAFRRDSLHLGCGDRKCTVPSLARQLWYRPRVGLAYQVAQMRSLFPERFSEELLHLPTVDIVSGILERVSLHELTHSLEYWVSVVETEGELLEDTIPMSATPDMTLFPDGQTLIMIEDELVEIGEFCGMYGLSLDRVLMRRLYLTDEELIEESLGELL